MSAMNECTEQGDSLSWDHGGRGDQRNNFHPLYTLYTPCNPVVLQGVFVLKCLLTEDVLLKIENTYRGSEMKIVTLLQPE